MPRNCNNMGLLKVKLKWCCISLASPINCDCLRHNMQLNKFFPYLLFMYHWLHIERE
jgi:hypothetical protein